MMTTNPPNGDGRIAMQINDAFGLNIDKDVVRRVLEKHYYPKPGDNDGPSWLTFKGHMKDSLWSIDLFRCESISLKSHWVLVIMDQFTRKIIGFSVHKGDVDGIAICCMFNKIISGLPLPKYISSDNDPLFTFHRWQANLRVLDLEEIKSVPYTPTSHPFIERVIGTVRRELLDRTLFWTANDLENKLELFRCYYNEERSHHGIDGVTPLQKSGTQSSSVISLENYKWKKHCRGLFKLPMAA
jgi:transposase InsO family protein